jgi:hypothetical protein
MRNWSKEGHLKRTLANTEILNLLYSLMNPSLCPLHSYFHASSTDTYVSSVFFCQSVLLSCDFRLPPPSNCCVGTSGFLRGVVFWLLTVYPWFTYTLMIRSTNCPESFVTPPPPRHCVETQKNQHNAYNLFGKFLIFYVTSGSHCSILLGILQTLRKVHQKYLESFKMWCWRRT